MSKTTPKKGVPRTHETGILRGLPKTDAVETNLDDRKLIQQLEQQLERHEAALNESPEETLQETIRELRHNLLKQCERLMPQAAKAARHGKPALLRLISRIVRSAR